MDAILETAELLDEVPCGIVSFADDGTVGAVNKTLLTMLGHAPGALIGGSIEAILTVSSRIFYQTHFFPLLKLHGKAEEVFLTLRSSGSQPVPVLVNAVRRPLEGENVTLCVLVPVPQRQKYEEEILHARRAAEEALRSNQDLIDARKDLERHAVELDGRIGTLEQQHADLAQLTSILSHDLREPVRKISVYLDVARREMAERLTPEADAALSRVTASCLRMDQLVTALREYLAIDVNDGRLELVDLNEALAVAHRKLTEQTGFRELDLRAAPLPSVEGDRVQLITLFYNLLENAVKFRSPDRLLLVRVEGAAIQHNRFRTTRDRYRYVDYAQITITDNGAGFEKRYAEYVFGMLKKIDPQVPGLGIGLALCKKIAENHHGSISADPEPGRGTTFTVLFPLRQSYASPADGK